MSGYYWNLKIKGTYNRNQPRIPAGQPTGGQWTSMQGAALPEKQHGGIVVYHGTKEEFIESIKKNGVRRGKEWFSRPPSVYYTTDEEGAKDFAKFLPLADKSHGTVRFALIEARIPNRLHSMAEKDTEGEHDFRIEDSWQLAQDIPPEYLVRAKIYSYKVADLYSLTPSEFLKSIKLDEEVPLGESTAHSVDIFIPVLLENETA